MPPPGDQRQQMTQLRPGIQHISHLPLNFYHANLPNRGGVQQIKQNPIHLPQHARVLQQMVHHHQPSQEQRLQRQRRLQLPMPQRPGKP